MKDFLKFISLKKREKYDVLTVRPGENRDYYIYIGNKILADFGLVLKAYDTGKKVVIITNPDISSLYAEVVEIGLKKEGFDVQIIEVPEGESSKNISEASFLLDQLIIEKLERQDVILALGGGVTGDLAGFVASIYLRGINFVQVPTSLLAQVDSSSGGKTAINHMAGKNLIGTFYQPKFTFIDISTLSTLPRREMYCGLAEIIKYGVICSEEFFCYLEDNREIINKFDMEKDNEIWQFIIKESCYYKAQVVEQDERESGLREILNFGHTAGHAVEAVFEYKKYLHGEAVAMGMKAAADIAYNTNMIDRQVRDRIAGLLEYFGFELKIHNVKAEQIIEKMYSDKKVRKGKIRFVLPVRLGEVIVRDDISIDIIKKSVQALM
ncbi:MAG: 3-dehydroquinate synthase [bacterium]|nr:3-dehydroquinate synthase [bacterium]